VHVIHILLVIALRACVLLCVEMYLADLASAGDDLIYFNWHIY